LVHRLLGWSLVASSKRTGDSYAERARVFKALADPHRLHIIDVLSQEGTLCGTDLAERVGISLALLSHHWKVLTEAGLISREQRGQTRYCAIECKRLQEVMVPWPAPPPEGSAAAPLRKARAKKAASKTAKTRS
jgi:DNA-binding transcriptional ArsR family regulator